MSKRKNLNSMLGVAAVAMMLGAVSAQAQSSGTGSAMGGASTTSQNAAGQTPANEAGKMSPTDQNETSSVKPQTSGASGSAGSSAAGAVSKSDQTMMKDLAYANMSEIQAAKIAQQKSSNDNVKNFAQKMLDDHTKAQDQLQQLAQSKGVSLPTQLDKTHQSEINKLSALSGDKLDKTYMSREGISDHRKTHALLTRIEKHAKDQDLKTLASNLLPTINEHLQLAKEMKSGKASTATGSSGTAGQAGSSSSPSPGAPSSPSSGSMGK